MPEEAKGLRNVSASGGSHLASGGIAHAADFRKVGENPDGMQRKVYVDCAGGLAVGAYGTLVSQSVPRCCNSPSILAPLAHMGPAERASELRVRAVMSRHRDACGLTNLRGAIGVYFQRGPPAGC